MGYWVRLTEDGIPSAYSGAWFDGAEWIEGVSSTELDTCRWAGSAWVLRDAVTPTEPTPEEIEAAKEADYQDRLAAREAAIDAAITASAAYRSFIRGGMTLTAYRDAASDIAAQFPMPERTL